MTKLATAEQQAVEDAIAARLQTTRDGQVRIESTANFALGRA
jgi:hypothetical protein